MEKITPALLQKRTSIGNSPLHSAKEGIQSDMKLFVHALRNEILKNDEEGPEQLSSYADQMIEHFRIGSVMTDSHDQETASADESRQPADMPRRINEAVARLLVTDGAYTQDREVRILFKDTLLPATEVRICRNGGITQVTFITSEVDVYRLLNNNRDAIEHHFNRRLKMKLNAHIILDDQANGFSSKSFNTLSDQNNIK